MDAKCRLMVGGEKRGPVFLPGLAGHFENLIPVMPRGRLDGWIILQLSFSNTDDLPAGQLFPAGKLPTNFGLSGGYTYQLIGLSLGNAGKFSLQTSP